MIEYHKVRGIPSNITVTSQIGLLWVIFNNFVV